MANKRNLAPESSQLVEPPLKQHQSEAQQEDDQAFEQSSTTSPFGQNNSSNNPFSPKPFGSTTPFEWRPQTHSSIISRGGTGAAYTYPPLEFLIARPDFKYASPAVKRHVMDTLRKKQKMEASWKQELEALGANGHKHDFPGIGPFGRGIPTSVGKEFEAVGGFRYTLPLWKPSTPFSVVSRPTVTEEHGGTSGQIAYNYERFESCVAIAGADYCVIVVDYTRDHTKISKLSEKCVMAACRGFQADVKALQVLSAENVEYEGQHKKPMSCPEMEMMFCRIQLSHPIYDFTLLGGLDSEGKGCLFKHFNDDAPRLRSRPIVPPPFPPIHKYKLPTQDVLAQLSETGAVDLARDVFESTTNTGDKLEIVVINADGVRRSHEDLKRNNSAVRFNC